jgi:predicted transcriptional regulator/transcriptional regulator with XRE-family HTH domain
MVVKSSTHKSEANQKIFAGPRLRRLRRDLGLAQVAMAQGLGISPSYLNLVERNQRPLSAQLLLKLAQTYDVDLRGLAGDETGRTVSDLTEIFSDPLLENIALGSQDIIELSSSNPAVAQAMIALYRAYRLTAERAAGWAEKMTDWSATNAQEPGTFAVEEVRDFFVKHGNHFPEMETAAEQLCAQNNLKTDGLNAALRAHLKIIHNISVQVMPVEFMQQLVRRFDHHSGRLFLSEALPQPARNFQAAYQICLLEHSGRMDEIVSRAGNVVPETKRLLRIGLANYFAGAVMMPYQGFLQTAEHVRYDIDLLCQRFDATFEQVCHRLTSLQRTGSQGVPFFFIRVDPAGNISKRLSAGGYHFARFGGACPRWNVHEAFRNPGKFITQVIEMPDKSAYFSLARTADGLNSGHQTPQPQFAIGLGCEMTHARRLTYSDGYDLNNLKHVTPVGLTCRLCERQACSHRAFPPLSRNLIVDENLKAISPYLFHSQS